MAAVAFSTKPIGSGSRDPIGYLRYANLVLYVRSNPLLYNDPTGLDQTRTIVGSLTPTTSPNNPSVIVYLKPGKPTVGYCGEFSWTSEWFLDINNASVEQLLHLSMGGFIGQEVTIVGQTLNCDGTVKENRSIHYWEAWEFFPALIDPKTADKNGYVKIGTDTFSLANKGDCTTGKWS